MTDAEDKTSAWKYAQYIATKSKVYIWAGVGGALLFLASSWVDGNIQVAFRTAGISLIITSGLLTYMVKRSHEITGELHVKLDTLIDIGESSDKKLDTLVNTCESMNKKLDKLPEMSEKLDKLPEMSEKLDKLPETLESINMFLRDLRNESKTNPPYHV
jgi:hypothetical protein